MQRRRCAPQLMVTSSEDHVNVEAAVAL